MNSHKNYWLICLVIISISTIFVPGQTWGDDLELLGETCKDIAAKIEHSWPSGFSINAPAIGNYLEAQILKLKKTTGGIFDKHRPESSSSRVKIKYEYVEKNHLWQDTYPENFEIEQDCLMFSPLDYVKHDCRRSKAILTKKYFENKTLPLLKKNRFGKTAYERNEARTSLLRLAVVKKTEAMKISITRALHRYEKKYLVNEHEVGNDILLINKVRQDIEDQNSQTSLIKIKNRQRHCDFQSGSQWLLPYKIESCYVKKSNSDDSNKLKAFAIYVLDLDPFLNKELTSSLQASYRIFYLIDEKRCTLDARYMKELRRKRGDAVQHEEFLELYNVSHITL